MAKVVSLSKNDKHQFSKSICDSLILLKGLGIEGDAHCGETVQHRSRVQANPDQPNLRQVHLIHSEFIAELQDMGFDVKPGAIGENILTQGIELLSLPSNTRLKIGKSVVLRVTGLRNPCAQLDNYQEGLTKACLGRDDSGDLVRKSGIMAVVEVGGTMGINDPISVIYPSKPYEALDRV